MARRSSRPVQALLLPGRLEKFAADLLHVQMWCLGRDVMYSGGNLLVQAGCERVPAPVARYHSAYSVALAGEARLLLWGFGLFYAAGAAGGLFIGRYRFRPQYTAHGGIPAAWRAEDLPPFSAPPADRRTEIARWPGHMLRWLGDYEAGIIERLGADYRVRVARACPGSTRPPAAPAAFAAAWYDLAQQCEDCLSQSATETRPPVISMEKTP
ncbi:MAG: hypothetical protein MUE40_03190 [Anaerolineae bacterium]|jgi:hypothetical protein|nr:hypothetical protein [Anaerolineae bacterium]